MDILNLLRSDAHISVNKFLAHEIGLEPTIVLCELISRFKWHESRDEIENGWFYCTVETLQAQTTLSKYKQTQAINKLLEHGLITYEQHGTPPKRYFQIHENALLTLITNKKSKNFTFKSEKTSPSKVKKFDTSNTNNKNGSISSSTDQDDDYYQERIQQGFTDLFNDEGRMSALRDLAKQRKVDIAEERTKARAQLYSNQHKYYAMFTNGEKTPKQAAATYFNRWLSKASPEKQGAKKSYSEQPRTLEEERKLQEMQ